jgi:hypothetical protein
MKEVLWLSRAPSLVGDAVCAPLVSVGNMDRISSRRHLRERSHYDLEVTL